MALQRLLVIRHGELHDTDGITADNRVDHHSLTVRGWQRAGALVRFFDPAVAAAGRVPDAIVTSAVGPNSESRRPEQTVAPLRDALRAKRGVRFSNRHNKHDVEAAAAEIAAETGTVLLCWEHSRLADIVRAVAGPLPGLPEKWPDDRYDLLWALERREVGWHLAVEAQLLLAGDRGAE